MSWREDWETKQFIRYLSDDGLNRTRVRLQIERGRVQRYAVQYKTVIEEKIYPVVRYDSAHGYPHRDLLDWNGNVADKIWLAPVDYGTAATEAVATIDQDWRQLREEFLRRRP
jgi:hypothetical protein